MMIPRYVIIMRFPVISQTDLFPEAGPGGPGSESGGQRRAAALSPMGHGYTAYRLSFNKVHATPTAAACWPLDLVEAFSFDTRRHQAHLAACSCFRVPVVVYKLYRV